MAHSTGSGPVGPTGKTHYATRGRGPGQWWPCDLTGGGRTATFYCPICGLRGTLQDHHIAEAGAVTPSVVCPHHERDRCFHDNVVLVEWNAN